VVANQLKTSEFHTVRKRQLERKLKNIRVELEEINQQEVALFSVSAENRAEEVRRRLMVFLFTETIDEKPFWDSQTSFMKSTDNKFLNNLILAYFNHNIYNEKELRHIARSGEWRFRWIASKHGEGLFGRPIADWSEMQNMLVYWSEYYDGVYESMERPPDYIIEEDVACDAWVQDQNKKHSQNRLANKKKGNKQKLDHAEQFVMVAKGDKEAIKKVQELNPEQVREQLRNEFKQIKKSGQVKEWELGERRKSTPVNIKRKGKR
jgi:hypothetical protein